MHNLWTACGVHKKKQSQVAGLIKVQVHMIHVRGGRWAVWSYLKLKFVSSTNGFACACLSSTHSHVRSGRLAVTHPPLFRWARANCSTAVVQNAMAIVSSMRLGGGVSLHGQYHMNFCSTKSCIGYIHVCARWPALVAVSMYMHVYTYLHVHVCMHVGGQC